MVMDNYANMQKARILQPPDFPFHKVTKIKLCRTYEFPPIFGKSFGMSVCVLNS